MKIWKGSTRRHYPFVQNETAERIQHGTVRKWLLTKDKEEFLKLTPKVCPEMSEEKIKEMVSKMKW